METGLLKRFQFTPTLDTVLYATGDVLFETVEVKDVIRHPDSMAMLEAIALNDTDDRGIALDLIFLSRNVSIGTLNAAFSMADADAGAITGIANVTAPDYFDYINGQVGELNGLKIPLASEGTSRSIFVGGVTRGAPTHTAAGITINLTVRRD